jgi:hypothetical protein
LEFQKLHTNEKSHCVNNQGNLKNQVNQGKDKNLASMIFKDFHAYFDKNHVER